MTEARQMSRPEVGFWMIKLSRGGVEVPASISYCDHEPGEPDNKLETPFLDAEIAGDRVPPNEVWHRRGRQITAQEHAFQVADMQHAKAYRPGDPKAEPRKPIDLLQAPLPF